MPNTKNVLQMGINNELLKKLMQDKKLTPAEMEKRRGVPEQTVKNIVNGVTKNPGVENLAPICEELDIPIEYVLFSHNKEVESKVIKDNPSAYNLKEMYEFQVAILNKAHETEINNIREHYERELKQQSEYYERIINSQEQQYEKRLFDKREHIDTIMLDKRWFRLASVASVIAMLALFFFIEFMTPGHGWFNFEKTNHNTMLAALLSIMTVVAIALLVLNAKNKIKNK